MTLTELVAAFLRRFSRDPVGALRLAWTRVARDPLWIVLRLDATLSPGVRTSLYPRLRQALQFLKDRFPHSGLLVVGTALLLQLSGDRRELSALLTRVASEPPTRGLVGLARLAAELGEYELTNALLAGLRPGVAVLAVQARAAWRAGHWEVAVELAQRARARGDVAGLDHLSARIQGDRLAVDPAWQPPAAPAPRAPARPRRVLHLVNNCLPYLTAGYTVRTQEVGLAQTRVGLDPVFVTKLGFPWDKGRLDASARTLVGDVEYLHVADPVAGTSGGLAGRVERSISLIGSLSCDLTPAAVQATTPYDNGHVGRVIAQAHAVPFVYEVRGFLEDTWASKRPDGAYRTDRYVRSRQIEGHIAATANHVVTLGHAMRDDLISRGVAADRITVIPNAVDMDRFRPRARGAAVRDSMGIDPGVVVLGYVSSLVPYEGVETLLDATRVLLDRGCSVFSLVVGDGPHRATLEHHARALGLEGSVRFTGRVPHEAVQSYYEALDVFVVPRRDVRVARLVTPLKPLEAMALELPVVVSDLPALRELIVDGVTGTTFAPEDPHDLADRLGPLVEDRTARRALGRRAREWVGDERSWARNGSLYREIYSSLGVGAD